MRDLLARVLADSARRPELSSRGWETLLAQAWQAGLIARLARHIVDHGWLADIPARPRAYLEGALLAAKRQEQEVRWEAECIRRALSDVDTPIVLLKGAAYVLADLPAAHGRLFSDVDVMVSRASLDEVESALFRAGWYIEKHDAYDLHYYRQWMHELPPMKHAKRGSAIDVHHTIAPPTSRYRVSGDSLLARARPITAVGQLHVLAPDDMVLHSALHLIQEGEFNTGLRDLLDIRDLLDHFGQDEHFWSAVFDRAAELDQTRPLIQILCLVREMTNLSWPALAVGRMEALWGSSIRFRAVGRLLSIAMRPQHPSCDSWLTPFARWLLFVRSHWLRMPVHLVVPHLVRKAYKQRFPPKPTGHGTN